MPHAFEYDSPGDSNGAEQRHRALVVEWHDSGSGGHTQTLLAGSAIATGNGHERQSIAEQREREYEQDEGYRADDDERRRGDCYADDSFNDCDNIYSGSINA